MAYFLQLRNANNYAAAGFSAVGAFGGATSGIGSGVGFEPAYYVNSEVDAATLKGWLCPLGTQTPMLGDGAGVPVTEIVYEQKFKINALPPGTRWLFHIGHNGVTPFPEGLVGAYVEAFGEFTVQVGNDFGVHATQHWNPGSDFDDALSDGLWHKLRIEYKEVTAPANQFLGTDIKVYLDDVLQTPDTTSNSIGYWDDSVDQAIAIGGTDTNNSISASHGDILISSDSTATLFSPTDDLVWDLNFEHGVKKVALRHPADPINPSTDIVGLEPKETGFTYDARPRYNSFILEDQNGAFEEIRYALQNSFPQNVNMWDSDFTFYMNLPTDLSSVATGVAQYVLYADDGATEIINFTHNFDSGDFDFILDSTNNTWTFPVINATPGLAVQDAGYRIAVKFVESSGVISLYVGTTLIGTSTLTSVDTPVLLKYFGAKTFPGNGLIKEVRVYDVAHSGEDIASIVDLHGATNTRILQALFDNNLNVAHKENSATWEAVTASNSDGYDLDVSGAHATGSEPTYGRSFYEATGVANVVSYDRDEVPGSTGPNLLNHSYCFTLNDLLNCDGAFFSFTTSGTLPQITFDALNNEVVFAVPGLVIENTYPIAINPGSRCVIQYNETTKKWAMQVDGVVAGVSTYDPDAELPLLNPEISLLNPSSYPAAGLSDFRIYSGWITATFVPLSIYQYHPSTGTFPAGGDEPPEVDQGIPDQNISEGSAWSYQFPANAFTDPQADNVYTATLSDNSPLPAGMTFTGATRTFTWAVPVDASYAIKVTATNAEGSANDTFTLTVADFVGVSGGMWPSEPWPDVVLDKLIDKIW